MCSEYNPSWEEKYRSVMRRLEAIEGRIYPLETKVYAKPKPRAWWVKPVTLEENNYHYSDPKNAGCIKVVEQIDANL